MYEVSVGEEKSFVAFEMLGLARFLGGASTHELNSRLQHLSN